MSLEIDLIVWVFSMVLLGCYAGTFTALEILSCIRLEKPANENGGPTQFMDRLLDTPIHTGLSLGVGRGLALAATVVTSLRIASTFPFGQPFSFTLTALILVASLAVPLFAARTAAAKNPERFVELSRYVIALVSFLFKPFVAALSGFLRRTAPHFLESFAIQIMPLKQKIELIDATEGYLEKEEREMMSSIFEFGDTVVREVMVPRIDMVAVNLHTDMGEALDVIMAAGHSRIPVYDETIDRIVGLVYTKDLLRKIISKEEFSLGEIIREVFFVPESKNIDDLLTEFKKRRKHMAIAVDEYGGTAGLVTMEDVLEELVGDIQDEFDEEEDLVVRVDDDSAVCNAKIRLDELNDLFDLNFTEDTVDTLGGLLYEKIGRVPRVGDVVRDGGIIFEIRSVLRQRIDKVLIKGLKSTGKKNGNEFN